MNTPEHLVIEEGFVDNFIRKLNEAAENGFKVVSSNIFYINYGDHVKVESIYYALLVKNPLQTSNDFHYKLMDELNEIKYELKEITTNLKYN